MTGRMVRIETADDAAFAPFGEFVAPPAPGQRRAFYSAHFDPIPPQAAPVLHVNRVVPSELPLTCDTVERHPRAAQCFLPLDVARYVVMVMPEDAEGGPSRDGARAFLVPGNRGVVFRPMVWHMGATVLDREGSFAVLMWRGGPQPDDQFRTIRPIIMAG